MSERISNKKQNFDGIDPQESLIKSLESIKSLLKQGDSKINQARENIARADSISNDSLEIRKTELDMDISNSTIENSSSVPKTTSIKDLQKQEFTEINDADIEEIVVEALPEQNIFNPDLKSSTSITKPVELEVEESAIVNIDTNSQPENINEHITDKISNNPDTTALNDLYDHNLIVPMLDEIVMPEDQNSSLFNMDSSVEIKLDEKLKSTILELSDDSEINDLNKIETPKDAILKSTYNSIKKPQINTKADIISFELSSNNKKNIFKKIDTSVHQPEKINPTQPKEQNNISLVEDSLVDISIAPDIEQVVIKETTTEAVNQDENIFSVSKKLTDVKLEVKENSVKNLEDDLTIAIDSTNYTDDSLTNISKSNNELIKDDKSNTVKNSSDEIDFSNIDGLDRLKFNADKMGALQKRVEKRVHNRLIQLIVQLDDEIKNIFTDEIKNCVAQELKNQNKD
jgi:hypothetical protein